MIEFGYVRTMARYGAWQNESLMQVANRLTDTDLRLDRGSFFKSIFGTFNHLLWGDRIWMNRFAGTPAPRMSAIAKSVVETEDWETYCSARTRMDSAITTWATDLDEAWLVGDMSWISSAAQREVTKPKAQLVMHFFNHATHHRGQIHAMLTAAGAQPGDTDLFMMPDRAE